MSLEEMFRKIVREEVEAVLVERIGNDLNLNTPTEPDAEEDPPTPTNKKTKKKKAKKKAAKKAKPPKAEEEDEDVENVPQNYEQFMARVKDAAMQASDPPAAKRGAMKWLEENYDTRKFSEIEVDDYPDVLAGVLDVISTL